MKSFNERNPIILAVAGLLTLAGVGVLTFYSNQLPLINSSTTYSADFTDASGLAADDDVRIAGVKVGSIDSISLSGAKVKVTFDVSSAWIGNQSTAAIKVKTLLGQEFLAIDPLGPSSQDPSQTIPKTRTTTPIDVAQALSGLATTTGAIDTSQLAQSFETLSQTFANTPGTVRATLQGLSALSDSIAKRDSEISSLALNANALTGVLAGNNDKFSTLINDGQTLLAELQARSAAITSLLKGTETFATQLSGLVTDNEATLKPALTQLSAVTDILTKNRDNLDKALKLIGPYYAMINDAAGSGHWLDVYICGLFDSSNAPQLDATAQRNCTPPGASK